MNKDDVLQKVNDYCSEKSYTSETLTDEFKSQFSDFFVKRHQDADINDESIISELQFNLNTAFSATSKGITQKAKSFEQKENDYKRQIEELKQKEPSQEPIVQQAELPDEIKRQLEELESFKNEQKRNEKFKEVLALAKDGVRQDLHSTLEKYAKDFQVSLDEDSKEQAKKLTAKFQDIFKDSIGNIKPLAPSVSIKRDEEFLASIPKVKI